MTFKDTRRGCRPRGERAKDGLKPKKWQPADLYLGGPPEHLALGGTRRMLSLTVCEQYSDAATHADADEDQKNEYEEDRNNESDSGPSRRVHEVWPDAPCDDSILVPPGWECGEFGIRSPKGQTIREEIVVVAILEDIEEQTFQVELACRNEARWIHLTCLMSQIASTSSIVALADSGLPVTSRNASVLVDFLNEFERSNRENIPRIRLAKHCGWFDTGEFLCGQEVIGGGGGRSQLRFVGDDAGDDQLVEGIRRGGTMAGWLAAIAPLGAALRSARSVCRARATAARGCSCAKLHLQPDRHYFDRQDDIADGRGIGLGVPGSQRSRWATDLVQLEYNAESHRGRAAILHGIPLILDDTNAVQPRNRSDIASVIYQFANGGGRGRGSRNGLAVTRSWQSVLISSGEEPITSFSDDGGTRARSLSLWGSPFPQGADTGPMVADLRDRLSSHFGHAGPQFVAYLDAHRDLRSQWGVEYGQCRRNYEQRAGGNNVASRLAASLATLELTARLAHEALSLPWEYGNVVDALWAELTAGADEADQAAVALRGFHSWAINNRGRFQDGTSGEKPSPNALGQWEWPGQDPENPCLLIFPHQLDTALRILKYTPESTRKHWKDRDWLRTESNKTTLRATINGERCAEWSRSAGVP